MRENYGSSPVPGDLWGGAGGGGGVEKGEDVPLSEDEQRILHEMEQKLYEHERGFVNRVRHPHPSTHRAGRISLVVFVLGFVLVVLSFRQSLLLATIGFLVMLRAAFVFERSSRLGKGTPQDDRGDSGTGAAEASGSLRQRLRTRFFQQH